MARVVLSARVDGDLAGWAKVYAKRRDTSLAAVLEEALREFREACEGGPSPAGVLAVRALGPVPRAAGASRLPARSEWERTMAQRQERLNKGRS